MIDSKPSPSSSTPERIPIVERGDRGFHGYGEPFKCSYGSTLEIYESSAASGPHVWLSVKVDPLMLSRQEHGEGTAHLDAEQARALIARLQAWLDEIPSRWGKAEGHV